MMKESYATVYFGSAFNRSFRFAKSWIIEDTMEQFAALPGVLVVIVAGDARITLVYASEGACGAGEAAFVALMTELDEL